VLVSILKRLRIVALICLPTHANAPKQAGTRLTYSGGKKGRVDLGVWL